MAMVLSMARGRLRLSLRPSPRPRLILTSCTDVVLDTMVDTTDMVLVTPDTMVMDSDTPYSARGLLMLRPIPTFFMEDTYDIDWEDTTDMDLDTDTESMARGLLMLRLSLILTTPDTMDLDTPDTSDMDTLDMPDSDTADTTSANRLHQDLSVNHRQNLGQKWIVISLKFPLPVLQFQCYHTKSVVMVSRKQENQSGKNPANIKITKIKKK